MKGLINNRNYWLVGGSLLLAFLCYRLAFKKTIEAWQENRRLNSQLLNVSDLSFQPGYLERKFKNLSAVADLYKVDSINYRSEMIAKVAGIAQQENVKVVNVPLPDEADNTQHLIRQKIEVKGVFYSLLKFYDQVEVRHEAGLVRSVIWKELPAPVNSKKDDQLLMELYLVTVK